MTVVDSPVDVVVVVVVVVAVAVVVGVEDRLGSDAYGIDIFTMSPSSG